MPVPALISDIVTVTTTLISITITVNKGIANYVYQTLLDTIYLHNLSYQIGIILNYSHLQLTFIYQSVYYLEMLCKISMMSSEWDTNQDLLQCDYWTLFLALIILISAQFWLHYIHIVSYRIVYVNLLL